MPRDKKNMSKDQPAGAEASDETRERIDEIKRLAAEDALDVPPEAEELARAAVELAGERDELFARLQRTVADYQNFERRAASNQREAREGGMTSVIRSVLPVMDHFDLALAQDPSRASAEQIIGGVRVIRDELFKVLQTFGVTVIDPAPNDEFDPTRHEAMLRQQAEGVAPGRIAAGLGVGYALGDRVIRPAKVAVAPDDDPAGDEASATGATGNAKE